MKAIQLEADRLYSTHQQTIYRQTDRMFAVLMAIQWLAGIAAALIISPRTWIGQTSQVNIHVWAAVFLGGVISFFPIVLAVVRPGHIATRYTIAIGQMLMSSLLIHLTGGRIETHFHVFGSLAFLSFYRDWRVLVPATLVVALDHMLRGIYYPQSVFGILAPDNWRWVEHAAWVIFEDIFLVLSCLRAQREMHQLANDTARLDASEARYRSVTDSASDAIISFDTGGLIVFVNQSAATVFGYASDELIGVDGLQLVPEPHRRRNRLRMRRYLAAKSDVPSRIVEMPLFRKSGRQFHAEISFASYNQDSTQVFTAVVRDVTQRKLANEAIKRSEEYVNLFKLANDAIIIFDPDSRMILNVNDYACRMYGYSRDEFLQMSLPEISNDPVKGKRYSDGLLDGNPLAAFETVHRTRDGASIDLLISSSIIEFEGRSAVLSINRDVTERNQAKAALEKNLSLLASTFEASADGIVATDLKNGIVTANEKFFDMWGLEKGFQDLAEATPTIIQQLQTQLREPDQFARSMQRSLEDPDEISVTILELVDGRVIERYTQPQKLDGRTVGRVLNYRDVTEKKRAEEQMLHDTLHDALTGLANRTLFMDHLRMAIERSKGKKSDPFAVLYLDFDRFKVVNDSLGHSEGDKLLKYIARRLETCIRTGDLVARLGGDEFVVLLSDLDTRDEAIAIAERIQHSLESAFNVSGRSLFMTTSIGVTFADDTGRTADDMLRDADIAMYAAKSRGPAKYQIFDHDLHTHASTKLQLETEMRAALELGQFRLFYQPIVRLADCRLYGFEALIRWEHPGRGLLSPDVFIPIAEENGMIVQLGQWTLSESCRQMHEWQQAEPAAKSLTVSVNLSGKEFLQHDLDEQVADVLTATGLDPRSLKLEITESHIMENSELAVKIIERLGVMGVQMSLDDFGTGYSSLSYLHRLPVTFLKIDRSFVGRMAEAGENQEIVSTIVHLAKSLKMKVIAEGIETPDQFGALVDLNCEFGQGYFFSPPLDPFSARQFISNGDAIESMHAELGHTQVERK